MPEVFACKKYQYDVGNLSHINLLGKLRQLYKHSWTELFNLIKHNVVDIIKPEEICYIFKEGIIYHEDDVIQAQLHGLT